MLEGLRQREIDFDRVAAEPAEFACDDLVGFGNEGGLAIYTEGLRELFAGGKMKEMIDIG